jgi:hypothetical protein
MAPSLYKLSPAADVVGARSSLMSILAPSHSGQLKMSADNLVELSSYLQTRVKTRDERDTPSPAESLRLVEAFSRVNDPTRREEIIEMVELLSTLKSR